MNIADYRQLLRAADAIHRFARPKITPHDLVLLREIAPAIAETYDYLDQLARSRHDELTTRECEVVSYLRRGKSIEAIAIILGCAQSTIEKHRQNLYAKIGASNRVELFLWFLVKRIRKHFWLVLGSLATTAAECPVIS